MGRSDLFKHLPLKLPPHSFVQDFTTHRFDKEFKGYPYDVEGAAALVLQTGFPEADELVEETLLHPPSAEEVTAHFESLAERQSL